MSGEDRILIHSAMENLAKSSLKAAESLNQVAKKANELAKEIEKNDLFERWLNSLDIPLTAWQKEILRLACTHPDKELYISMPRCYGRHMVLKLIEQYKQMIKGEKEMQKKLDKFDMKDVHSGYVVKFRNGKLALCMRVGAKFTKIFACVDEESSKLGAIESQTFVYASRYVGYRCMRYDVCKNMFVGHHDFDIVEVYGLIEGVRNYLNVGDTGPISIKNRPLLWEEEVPKKMTLEEIEKKLGHKVEIVEAPIKTSNLCDKCKYNGMRCFHNDCTKCPLYEKENPKRGYRPCKCIDIKKGDPCPYFEEAK